MGIFFVQFFAEIFLVHEKTPAWEVVFLDLAGPTRVELAISSVTGRRTRPLYHEPLYFVVYRIFSMIASDYVRFLTDKSKIFKIRVAP